MGRGPDYEYGSQSSVGTTGGAKNLESFRTSPLPSSYTSSPPESPFPRQIYPLVPKIWTHFGRPQCGSHVSLRDMVTLFSPLHLTPCSITDMNN